VTSPERTRQQLDPVGTLGSRMLAIVLAVGAFYYGIVMTVRSLDQVSNLPLAILALLWLAAAALTVVIASSPNRAPFTRPAHIVVHLLAVGAVALSVASQWGTNTVIQDDFGPLSLGLLLLAIGPYRPAIELATAGSLSAVFVGFLTLLEVPVLESTTPPVAFVLAGMAPVLALSYASAVYSGRLVESLERWQRRAMRSVATRTSRLKDGIARSVQQDRVMILGRDVLPFFNSVLDRTTITPDDRARAREIAESIRALMVAEADRTWLVVVVDDGADSRRLRRTVIDPDGRASAMVSDQRTVLRALIVAILDEPTFEPDTLTIELGGRGRVSRGVVTARIDASDPLVRSAFAPYFAVMRIVFSRLRVEFHDQTLTIGFSYEQR
jgi:hypothetical protein